MQDSFGRHISYLRVSVTDRCDFRCVYCMSEHMSFLPRKEMLSLDELERLGGRIGKGLKELTLTTNGSQLANYAQGLYDAGVRRVNVSLDTRDPDLFRRVTRWGELDKVMAGIGRAAKAGLKLKINTVALKDLNEEEIPALMGWAHAQGFDFTLIETMPLGEVEEDRADRYLPLSLVRARLERNYTLTPSTHRTGGPARYFEVAETGGRLGLITPLTHNFCESCNRVRLTCTGMLYMCLGQDDSADLREILRASQSDAPVYAAIDAAMERKPRGHDFVIDRRGGTPHLMRPMSLTGG